MPWEATVDAGKDEKRQFLGDSTLIFSDDAVAGACSGAIARDRSDEEFDSNPNTALND